MVPATLLGLYSCICFVVLIDAGIEDGLASAAGFFLPTSLISLSGMAGCAALLVSISRRATLNARFKKVCAFALRLGIASIILAVFVFVRLATPGRVAPSGLWMFGVLGVLGVFIVLSAIKQIALLTR